MAVRLAALVLLVVAAACSDADGAKPDSELCATLEDLLGSVEAYSRDPTESAAAAVSNDYRRLSQRANRVHDGEYAEEASTARAEWSEFQAVRRDRLASESDRRQAWADSLEPLLPLDKACDGESES